MKILTLTRFCLLGWLLAGGLTAVAAEPVVVVSFLSGEQVRGELLACSDEQVSVRVDGRDETFPASQTLKIEIPREYVKLTPQSSDLEVALSDSTRINVDGIEVTGEQFRLQTEVWGELTGPANRVRTVRFVKGDSATMEKWDRLLERESTKDLLVIRKDDSIDFVDGIVGGIDGQSVVFLLDGEAITVSREKVFGVIYRREPVDDPNLTGLAILSNGNRVALRSLDFRDGEFEVETPIGLSLRGPFEGLQLLDFSPGRLVYLSEMQPRVEEYTPFFDIVWKYRRDRNFDGGMLRVGGKSYERGLCVHSRTLLGYRLAGEFRRFQAVMGIDELVGHKGHVHVTIKADDRVLFEGNVIGGTDPHRLDFDISGARDLEILVDFGEDLDIADHLALADARLVK
jgi:hypothetical protein